MKRCAKCYRQYADLTLEFCLEDGTPLVTFQSSNVEQTAVLYPLPPTVAAPLKVAEPETLPDFSLPETQAAVLPRPTEKQQLQATITNKTEVLKEKAISKGFQVLEIIPIIFALMQNYWQWLYFSRPQDFQFPDFLWSSNFLVWLVLTLFGLSLSLFALKSAKNKGFAIVGLVILAINLLLCIVPRRI